MLIALAMMAQDIPLNAEASVAMECSRASNSGTVASEDEAITTMSQSIYFLMRAADADRADTGLVLRASALAPGMARRDFPEAERSAKLTGCDRRYPLARSGAPVKLPANAFDHDLMCSAATSYFIGALNGAGIKGRIPELRKIQSAYTDRLQESQFEAKGIVTQDQYNEALGEALRLTLPLGNLEQVVKACTADLTRR